MQKKINRNKKMVEKEAKEKKIRDEIYAREKIEN